jgi:hypothetical protein
MLTHPTPMSTSRSGVAVDGNVACHLTRKADKSWKIQEKVRVPGFEPWWVASHQTILPLDYKTNHAKRHKFGVLNIGKK